MIFGVSVDDLVPLLNVLGIGILGIIAAFGVWFGRKSGASDVEVAGALVDSESVQKLTAAIEAHTREVALSRKDGEKERQASYRMIETGGRLANEIEELRRALVDATREVARSR